MEYKLFHNSLNDKDNIIQTVLLNRGVKDWSKYLSLDESCCENYNKLNNIECAVRCFDKHFEGGDEVSILVDTDP